MHPNNHLSFSFSWLNRFLHDRQCWINKVCISIHTRFPPQHKLCSFKNLEKVVIFKKKKWLFIWKGDSKVETREEEMYFPFAGSMPRLGPGHNQGPGTPSMSPTCVMGSLRHHFLLLGCTLAESLSGGRAVRMWTSMPIRGVGLTWCIIIPVTQSCNFYNQGLCLSCTPTFWVEFEKC